MAEAKLAKKKLSTASIHEVDLRLQALEKNYNYYENIQSAIEELDENKETLDIRTNFEELYFTLYQLRLSFFTGDYTQWITYFDTFTSLVYKNPALDDVTRFHYLRSSLKEDALLRIESVDVAAENDQVVLKLLIDRYQKRPLTREHIRHLLNLQSITKVSAAGLRDLVGTVSLHVRLLKSLGRSVTYWDDLLVEIFYPSLTTTPSKNEMMKRLLIELQPSIN